VKGRLAAKEIEHGRSEKQWKEDWKSREYKVGRKSSSKGWERGAFSLQLKEKKGLLNRTRGSKRRGEGAGRGEGRPE